MQLSRRRFAGWLGATAVVGGVLGRVAPQSFASEKNPSMRATIERELKRVEIPSLRPPWRLPVEWYRATVRRLQAKLRDQGLQGVLCTNGLNHTYLAGFFLTKTERPMWLWVPATGEPAFFHPGLDRDLVASWWVHDHKWYFDFQHTNGYNQVVWEAGAKADLWEWVCQEVKKRGGGRGKLGVDLEAPAPLAAKLKEYLPEVEWSNLEDELLHMRQVKTGEEIALTQKGIDLHDAMLGFARGYILEHGTSATDYDVRLATSEFGTRKLMAALGPELDARPHTGVGLSLGFGCRTGRATAYPHPNQFFFKRIEKGDA
ncbi:MAG: aminopeptidase P family N-terminal domain-containing protein, partial [Terriglobia bacterium]